MECWQLCDSSSTQAPGGPSGPLEGEKPVRRMERAVLLKTLYDFGQSCYGRLSEGSHQGRGARSNPAQATLAMTSMLSEMWQCPPLGARRMAMPSRMVETSDFVRVNSKAWLSPYLPSQSDKGWSLTPCCGSVFAALVGHREWHRARNQGCLYTPQGTSIGLCASGPFPVFPQLCSAGRRD